MSCETDDLTIRRELRVDASPEALWQAVSEPDWLAPEADLELVPGGTGRFVDEDGVERLALVETVEPGRRLTFRWWPADGGGWDASRVSLTVVADGDGARLLVLEQPTLPADRLSAEARAGRAEGWNARLERLALVLSGPVLAAVV